MTSVAGLTLSEAIIPLKQSFSTSDIPMTKVEHHWQTGTGAKYSKMYLPVCDDPSRKELFIYVINEFDDACDNSRLHLDDAEDRYSKFRQVLEGSLRIDWQTISNQRTTKTLDTFQQDIFNLLSQYFSPSSRDDQLDYLQNSTKPFTMTVGEVSSRLLVINQLGQWLPGSWDNNYARSTLYLNDTHLKRALFTLMPLTWRVEFAKSGKQLDEDAYKYSMLTQYMALQESLEKRTRKRPGAPITAGSRGRGRGGSGRGYGGRAYSGNYGGRGYRGHYGGHYGGRGYGGRGPGRGYGSYNQGFQTQAQNNPFVRAAQGGRYGPQPGYNTPRPAGRGGYQGGRAGSNVPRVSHSPQRRFVPRGRGPGPQLPQFMAEDHYYGEPEYYPPAAAAPQDHYYEESAGYGYEEEHYYGDEHYQGDDQYYQGEQDTYYQGGQEMYYQDDGSTPQEASQEPSQEQDEQKQESHEESHFLQDFGY